MVETYVWAFVVIMITLILAGIVFALLYSVTFVTQPIKSMAPIDSAYTKMLNDIVLLIVGGIGGVVGKKGVGAMVQSLSSTTPPTPIQTHSPSTSVAPVAIPVATTMPDWNWMGYKNPELDESWTPGPPPTTPPEHMEEDAEREVLAAARNEVKAA